MSNFPPEFLPRGKRCRECLTVRPADVRKCICGKIKAFEVFDLQHCPKCGKLCCGDDFTDWLDHDGQPTCCTEPEWQGSLFE